MNKNTKVALIELNDDSNSIEKIYEIYNIDYAPLRFKNAQENIGINDVKSLNDWFKGRGIPDWRKDIENLLNNLGISSPDELLNKFYALSLSDQYWIKEEHQNLEWKDINFFTNNFEYKGYFDVSLNSKSNIDVDLHSPNNTTDGMLQKAWIIDSNNDRILVKGTYSASRQEPINEWLVSQICKKLNIDYCNYEIDVIDNKIVSKCKDFINENEEIVSAYEIFYSEKKSNNTNDFNHYINILEKNGILNARKQVENMFLIDYIVMNFDRHLKNYGIIRNVETLEWERATPIFDTGECMECNKITSEMKFGDNNTCKFFSNTEMKLSKLLRYIDITRFDFTVLNDIPNEFKEKLLEYQKYTDMQDERIEKLYDGLNIRIDNLINYQKKQLEDINEELMESNEEDYEI